MTSNLFIFLAVVGIPFGALPLIAQPTERITRNIIRPVSNYANAIACPGVTVDPAMGVALVPFKDRNNREDERYAVLWEGDIGCSGGSGSQGTALAIVTIGAGNTAVVDPLRSSPAIRFESPARLIDRIVGNTRDTLVLEGKEHGPKDAECCPSVSVRFTLRVDQRGNWKLVEKKIQAKQ